MQGTRKALCTAALLATLVAPALSGCASTGTPAAAGTQAGVVEELIEQLKKEDDEAETAELASLREIRREQEEQARQKELEPS